MEVSIQWKRKGTVMLHIWGASSNVSNIPLYRAIHPFKVLLWCRKQRRYVVTAGRNYRRIHVSYLSYNFITFSQNIFSIKNRFFIRVKLLKPQNGGDLLFMSRLQYMVLYHRYGAIRAKWMKFDISKAVCQLGLKFIEFVNIKLV